MNKKVSFVMKLLALAIPTVLVAISIYYLFLFKTETSFFGLSYEYVSPELNRHLSERLEKGRVWEITFPAVKDNLGLVFVRFYNNGRINDDKLVFRIKEAGSNSWFYTAEYNVDQFWPNRLFPFGFPIQANSENMNYTFQLESRFGTEENSVSLSNQNPKLVTYYQYNKSKILANTANLFDFLYSKISSILIFSGTRLKLLHLALIWFAYLGPLVYLYKHHELKHKVVTKIQIYLLKVSTRFDVLIYLLGLLVLVLGKSVYSELLVVLFWLFSIAKYSKNLDFSYIMIILLFSLITFSLVFNLQTLAYLLVNTLFYTLIYTSIVLFFNKKQ